jgi:chromosome segregation ATPase
LLAQAAALQGKSLGELQTQVHNEAAARAALSGSHSQLAAAAQTLENRVQALQEELGVTVMALRDETKLRVRLQEAVESEQGRRAALETRMKLLEVAVRDGDRARLVESSELRTSNTNLKASQTKDHAAAMDALAGAKQSLQSAIDTHADRSANWQSDFRQVGGI